MLCSLANGDPIVGQKISNASKEKKSICVYFYLFRRLKELVTRLGLLRLDHTEYTCLKALALFRPDVPGVRQNLQVRNSINLIKHHICFENNRD